MKDGNAAIGALILVPDDCKTVRGETGKYHACASFSEERLVHVKVKDMEQESETERETIVAKVA